VDTAPGSVRQRSRAQFVYMIIAIHVYVRYGISMPATPRTSSREDYRTPRACYRKAPVRRETAEERAQRQTGQLPAQMQALKEAERAVQVLRIAERKGDSRATVLLDQLQMASADPDTAQEYVDRAVAYARQLEGNRS
jgi:hypothetical protein